MQIENEFDVPAPIDHGAAIARFFPRLFGARGA